MSLPAASLEGLDRDGAWESESTMICGYELDGVEYCDGTTNRKVSTIMMEPFG